MKRIINITLFALVLFVTSCSNKDIFFQYYSLPPEGWSKDSVLVFDVPISDTTANYNVYIYIRNGNNYPYQNFWFFTTKTSPDELSESDTIECYLADQQGKWLGSGAGAVFEMPVLFEKNIRFNKSGTYRYSITQGMREDVLVGIQDIGLRVEKTTNNGEK